MRLRIINKEKEFLDFNIKLPLYFSTKNLKDKYAIMIVEEDKDGIKRK